MLFYELTIITGYPAEKLDLADSFGIFILDTEIMMATKRLTRIVHKNGNVNILNERPGLGWINPRRLNFLEMKWYTFVVLFCTINLFSFIIFAGIYMRFAQKIDQGM